MTRLSALPVPCPVAGAPPVAGNTGFLAARRSPRAVNGLLAAWTLLRAYKAMYGPEESGEFRTRAADAGRTWPAHRGDGARG